MTLKNVIPTAWHAALLDNLNDGHVYVDCANRDYEGDIKKQGDTVKINTIGRVTIGDYSTNGSAGAPETLQDSQVMLTIDKQKYFNFEIDDIDKAQQKPQIMNAAMKEAGWGLADAADAWMATLLAAGTQAANKLTALTRVGTGGEDDDAYEALVDLDVKLTENNVPRTDRWCVVAPWVEGLLRKDARFVAFGTPENRAALVGKPVGAASGFDLWVSNNVPVSSSVYTIIAGYKGACAFAEQIMKVEPFRPEQSFSDAVKGLHVYGGKVVQPHGLAYVKMTAA